MIISQVLQFVNRFSAFFRGNAKHLYFLLRILDIFLQFEYNNYAKNKIKNKNCSKNEAMMKRRLFDFSIWLALTAVLAYGMMLTLFGYTFVISGHKPIFAVVFALLVLSFLFLLWYFVIMSARMEENGIRQGAKWISKESIQCRTEYSLRFREGQILLRDKTLDYTEMNAKYKKKKEIRIQATPANIQKLSEYLGKELTMPKKPPRRRKKEGLTK